MSSEEFKTFIISLLQKANLQSKTLKKYTDAKSLAIFRQAFTHKSHNPTFNYELLEFYGDTVVNFAVSQYIRKRFPEVISMKWLTKLEHNLSSKITLANLAKKAGFLPHILYDKKIVSQSETTLEHLSMMEDVFEAFFGALVTIFNKSSHRGVGYAVAYTIITSFYNTLDISLKWEDVFDAKSRLKELYDNLGWVFNQNISTRRNQGRLITTIWGYSDPKINIGNGIGSTKQESQETASLVAILFLRNQNIMENIPTPYIKPTDDSYTLPQLPSNFKSFIENILRQARIKSTFIKTFTNTKSLGKFRLALTHISYSKSINYNLNKFEGITIVDMIIAEYLQVRFPRIGSEKWLTNIKHNIVSQGNIAKIAGTLGFPEYVLYGKDMEDSLSKHPNDNTEYLSMLESAFKAFMGALVKIIDLESCTGVGYAVVYKLISHYLDEISISIECQDVFDSKSRLKELFDKYGWSLDQNIITSYDQETNQQISEIFGYPLGNKHREPNNKRSLAKEVGRTKKKAQKKAASKALDVLSRLYNIQEIPLDPYQ
uniref:Ribonuclease III n=1 Tax=Marseillevirus LCMAC102 TaxID=2506603 RepID=A0A481YUT0_9VIRU|nr:MAG: ribonuclease III [Marseillevirus LCMAC102]